MKYTALKNKIKEKNMSIREVAIKANIVPQGLYAAINGKCEFWPAWRKRVAEALEMPEAELFSADQGGDLNENENN